MKMTRLRKFNTLLIVVLTIVLVLALAVACTPNTPEQPNNPNNPNNPSNPSNPSDPTTPEPAKKDITGVTFVGDTVTYDGTEHEIVISGELPDGVDVKYDNNKGTDAGEYNATATLSGKGYNTLTLEAKLTIDKAEIPTANLTFTSKSVEYDGLSHSIQIVGNVPAGVSVTYYYDGVVADGATAPGTHEVKAVLSSKNYKTLELTAKLTITSKEEMLYSAFYNGYAYFQNSLDGNRLYRATGTGTLAKVSNDVATYFTSNSTNLFFYSGSLFSQTIKSLSDGTPSTVFNPGRATYLACDDNGYIYYAKANLVDTKGENGIYKVKISEDDPTPVRLTTDKANYIAYYNNYIYYCNTSNNSRLYRVSVNGGQSQQLSDNKVSDIIVADGAVYFTQHTTTNSAIYKYTVSSGTSTKLCNDNGAYLTKVGEYIYYVNKDLLTSNIFGKGIYRVSTVAGALVGEKVLEADEGDGYYSLASDGSYLYYYRRIDKHFYRYNISTNAETDLMRDFTPSETTTFSGYPYAHLATYNGEIYYTNPLDGSSLYKYNTQTKQNFKVLADSVSNVYFNGDYMYYNTFIVTNYAMWRLDMTNPEAEPEKISSHRYEHLIFEGGYIYALRVQPPIIVGQNNTNRIVRLDLDGQNETELYKDKNVHITSMYLFDGKFHFTINPAVGYKYIYTHDFDGALTQSTNVGVKSDNFVISGSSYYYYDHTANKLMSCDFDGKNVKTLVSNVDITDIYEYNGVVYYTSKSSQNTGIYAYNTTSGQNTRLSTKVGHGFKVIDGKLYFINIALTYSADYPSRSSGDGHLYSINLSNNAETKVA